MSKGLGKIEKKILEVLDEYGRKLLSLVKKEKNLT